MDNADMDNVSNASKASSSSESVCLGRAGPDWSAWEESGKRTREGKHGCQDKSTSIGSGEDRSPNAADNVAPGLVHLSHLGCSAEPQAQEEVSGRVASDRDGSGGASEPKEAAAIAPETNETRESTPLVKKYQLPRRVAVKRAPLVAEQKSRDPVTEQESREPAHNDEQLVEEEPAPCKETPLPSRPSVENAVSLPSNSGRRLALSLRKGCLCWARYGFTDDALPDTLEYDALCQVAPEMEELDLSKNKISGSCLPRLLGSCRHFTQLRVVRLFGNRLDDMSAPILAQLSRRAPQLAEMHLSHNNLTDIAVKQIVAAGCEGYTRRTSAQRQEQAPLPPLWLRLEHNLVERPGRLLERFADRHLAVCAVPRGCNVGRCPHGAKVHLPYFQQQRPSQNPVPHEDQPSKPPHQSSSASSSTVRPLQRYGYSEQEVPLVFAPHARSIQGTSGTNRFDYATDFHSTQGFSTEPERRRSQKNEGRSEHRNTQIHRNPTIGHRREEREADGFMRNASKLSGVPERQTQGHHLCRPGQSARENNVSGDPPQPREQCAVVRLPEAAAHLDHEHLCLIALGQNEESLSHLRKQHPLCRIDFKVDGQRGPAFFIRPTSGVERHAGPVAASLALAKATHDVENLALELAPEFENYLPTRRAGASRNGGRSKFQEESSKPARASAPKQDEEHGGSACSGVSRGLRQEELQGTWHDKSGPVASVHKAMGTLLVTLLPGEVAVPLAVTRQPRPGADDCVKVHFQLYGQRWQGEVMRHGCIQWQFGETWRLKNAGKTIPG